MGSEFAAVAGLLDATEGEAGVGLNELVGGAGSGVELEEQVFGPAGISGKDGGAEAVGGSVGEADGV